jgi:6-phosphogluconolactonase
MGAPKPSNRKPALGPGADANDPVASNFMKEIPMSNVLAFVGTYTRDDSVGVYAYTFDVDTGELFPIGSAPLDNPSYLALHPSGKVLYAINEVSEFNGEKGGAISALAISDSGDLTLLNQQSVKGPGPCHLCIDATGKYALVANYGGGSVCVLPIGEDGALHEASDFIQHEGSSINERRQKEPHAHSINLDTQNRFAYVADLGMDKVLAYELDLQTGKLALAQTVTVKPGQGPRHFDMHPNGKYAYLINEIGNTVNAYDYEASTGALTQIQSINTLPDGFFGSSHTADIHVSPDGRFVYGSNRGHDSITIYAVGQDGRLTRVGQEPTGGENPRNFAIDPEGNFLLAANQNTNNIVTFRINKEDGGLEKTGAEINVPRPVCLKFLQR